MTNHYTVTISHNTQHSENLPLFCCLIPDSVGDDINDLSEYTQNLLENALRAALTRSALNIADDRGVSTVFALRCLLEAGCSSVWAAEVQEHTEADNAPKFVMRFQTPESVIAQILIAEELDALECAQLRA